MLRELCCVCFSLLLIRQTLSLSCSTPCTSIDVRNQYYEGIRSDTTRNFVEVKNNASPFPVPGNAVMIIQMQDGNMDFSNTPSYGSNLDPELAGRYEFNVISQTERNIAGESYYVSLALSLQNEYSAGDNDKFQVISFPLCGSVSLSAAPDLWEPWNGNTGGVFVLLAQQITFQTDIIMTGEGFRGGEDSIAPIPFPNNPPVEFAAQPRPVSPDGSKGEGFNANLFSWARSFACSFFL